MKKLIFIIFIFLLVSWCLPCAAANKWSTQNYLLELTYLTAHAIDWRQTRTIAKNPGRYTEKNRYLGKHPTVREVDEYFLFSTLIHVGVTHFLPAKLRPIWQCIAIGVSVNCVQHNYSVGIKIDW